MSTADDTMTKPNSYYETIVAGERKRAFRRAWLINFFLVLYFIFAITYVITLHVESLDHLLKQPMAMALYFLAANVLSYLWARSSRSIGGLIVHRTNPILKNLPAEPGSAGWYKSVSGGFAFALLILTVYLGVSLIDINLYTLFDKQGLQGAQRIFSALMNPNLSIIDVVLAAMVETIFIALMATALAIPIAFLLSFFMARNLMKYSRTAVGVYTFLRFLANFARSVEPLIWAIIFSVWVGIGPFAGMLALMIHSIAALTKLYSEQIENIDRGPIEAIEATGANRIQVVWYAVVPQIVLPYLSFTIYRWDINIRMATIIGLVGGGGIGTLLMQYQGIAKWNEVGTIVITIAAVVWVMDYLSARIREAIY